VGREGRSRARVGREMSEVRRGKKSFREEYIAEVWVVRCCIERALNWWGE